MQLTKDKQILIVGLGLLGGSYAEGLTESGYTVGAIDISDESIKTALSRGIIAHGETTVNSSYVGQFDLIILALYPEAAVQWMRDYQHLLKPNAIITDVTGVKCPVLYPIQSFLREDLEMIGAHPMAGKERSGVTFADAKMLRGANYIITPTSKNTEYAITLCRELGEALGFGTITCLSPEEHDEMIGFLSQLTHCIAVSLMTSRDTASFVDYSGDSFRDLTRIAKINEDMLDSIINLATQWEMDMIDPLSVDGCDKNYSYPERERNELADKFVGEITGKWKDDILVPDLDDLNDRLNLQ